MRHEEDRIQEAVFTYAKYVPELKGLLAIPNGGKRNAREAARLKRQGVKSGVPDIFLPLPIPGCCAGLWIEIKAGKGRPSDNQKAWLAHLDGVGYRAMCCTGLDAVKAALDGYVAEYQEVGKMYEGSE